VGLDFYDDFSEPAKRAPGPRHARQVDPDKAADIERRMAAMRARYLSDQHGCRAHKTGACGHPNHRRDLDLLATMLDMLGLDHGYPEYTEAEHMLWLKWLGQAGPPEGEIADAA
jgi:hypothetical protein